MKRALSPYSSSSSSCSSRDDSPRAKTKGSHSPTHAAAVSSSRSPKRRRLETRSPRRRSASRSASSSSRSCSSSSSDRSLRDSGRARERRKTEPQKLNRCRSKASSESENSDGIDGVSPILNQSLSTTFDVERTPYDTTDHVLTLDPMTIADAIKTITENKYDELTRNRYDQPNTYSKDRMRKVLASVVMERKVAHRNNRLCIVSLGAGSKSISGAFLTKDGNRVHDCHAEVLARRGFIRFMYSQLEEIKNGGNERMSIFKRRDDQMYALRDNVAFHLFISKPPCGDASVFGLHENHPNRERRGIARVTPSDGEGAIHISWPPEDDKKFDDYASHRAGARLHKMCCSAKIARWNVIGVQGALLSLYIEPVYLSSITIGSRFHDGHLKRAVFGRVKNIKDLPSCYRINDPHLHHVSTPDDTTEKSHKMSLNWYLNNNIVETLCVENGRQPEMQLSAPINRGEELIECQYGKPPDSTHAASRLSKSELFRCFISLWDCLASRTLKEQLPGVSTGQCPYSTVKALAKSYNEAKANVAGCFASMPYGSRWLKMPPEVDQFSILDSGNEDNAGDTDSSR